MPESTLRILLVEDNPADAQLVLQQLKEAGFNPEFTRVETEAEFLANLEQVPDLVLCDYNLPQFNALRALELLTERRPEVPFLIVSGSIGEETAVEAMRRGATDYLLKDRLGRLGTAVAHALEQRKLREAERKSREALKASEEQYRALADSIPQIVWTPRPNGEIEYINRRAQEYVGLAVANPAGFAWEQVIHPDDLPRTRLRWGAVVQTEEPHEIEFRILRSDGDYRWHIARQVAVRDQNGSIIRWFGTCTDIHSHKQIEERLRQTSELLQAVADGTSDAIYVKDSEGRYLLFNAAAARFVGRSVEDVLGHDDTAIFGPADARLVMDRDRAVMESGQINTDEEELTAAEATRIYLATKAPFRDALGNIIGVIGISRDITNRRKAELALRLRDRAIQAASQGILITDPNVQDNPIIYASPAFERLTGYTAAETVGRNCRFLQGKDSDRATVGIIREAVGNGRSCSVELLNYRKDGTPFWSALAISPVHEDGRLTHFIGVQTDVTDRRKLEEQFRQSQKMEAVGRLAGGVAHDFNNLLTVITGYSEILLGSFREGDPFRGMIDQIRKAGERAASLTRQLLAFSRKQMLVPEVFDLNFLLNDMAKMLSRLIGEDIDLKFAAERNLWLVKADPGQMEQVVMNLVVNSRDAMPTGGKMTIETRNVDLDETYAKAHSDSSPGQHVLVAVSDTGCGMDEATKARIFEPFFSTKGEKGTGLGLATVFGIVKQSGGHIEVYSEPGVGTTFKIYLPRAKESASKSKMLSPHPSEASGAETVLLVEDEEGVRTLAKLILKKSGIHDPGSSQWRRGAIALRAASRTNSHHDYRCGDAKNERSPTGSAVGAVAAGNEDLILVGLHGRGDRKPSWRDRSRYAVFAKALHDGDVQRRARFARCLTQTIRRVDAARNGGVAFLICELHQVAIDIIIYDVVFPDLSSLELGPHVRPLRPDMKALCVSGYTDDSVVSHGIIIVDEDWERLPPEVREEITSYATPAELLSKLTQYGAITAYQAARIANGTMQGLILGNYRVLERIGVGGMGVIFKAEHVDLRRSVATKMVAISSDQDPRVLSRFNFEMRAVAQLQHPNIVSAIDAGRYRAPGPDTPEYRYFVMEYVPGQDLDEYVKKEGPLEVARACDLIHQAASALAEAHKHDLVHRDIKPSNIRVTPEGQAKLLDFGLARNWNSRLTQPGTMLGTIDYMAPEQAADAGSVDIRADIYGPGGTLYWCLTGQPPFPLRGNLAEEVARRLTWRLPTPRSVQPDLPIEFANFVVRMLARNPADRFATPRAVMQALVPFLNPAAPDRKVSAGQRAQPQGGRTHQLLIVDDNTQVREFTKIALQGEDMQCDEASSGEEALRIVRTAPYDLVVLDIDMPGLSGHQVCRQLREDPPSPHLKIIMFSGGASTDEMAQIMNEGADDFITKPFSIIQLQARVRAALRLKEAQQRAETLNEHLLAANRGLEANLTVRDVDYSLSRRVLVLVLAELVGKRDELPELHLSRMPLYCHPLAEEAAKTDCWRGHIDEEFIQMLECCAPLHDIGNATLPGALLKKPGRLTMEERLFMQTHASAGADTLEKVARKHGLVGAFLPMALDVIRHHHERFDGHGYPDRLAGDDIPLSARIVAIADVYDALRSRRSYKPSLSHASTVEVMMNQSLSVSWIRIYSNSSVAVAPISSESFEECRSDHLPFLKPGRRRSPVRRTELRGPAGCTDPALPVDDRRLPDRETSLASSELDGRAARENHQEPNSMGDASLAGLRMINPESSRRFFSVAVRPSWAR